MLTLPDLAVIIGSLIAVYVAARKGAHGGVSDYLLAGRKLTTPFFVASLVATWYGAVLASGEFIVRYGMGFILCFGLPYYVIAIAYAAALSKRVHTSAALTIPEQFGIAYGRHGRTFASIMLLVISTPASYQLMIGLLVSQILGVSTLWGIALGTLVSIAYILDKGLRSDVYANVVQFVLMYAGMIVLVASAMWHYGNPIQMWQALPEQAIAMPGAIGWTGVIGWMFIALQTFIDPNFYVRTVAASDERTARRGLALSVAFWMGFDSLQLLAGLYIVAYAPNIQPTESYLAFASAILPPVSYGLFIASLLAAVMSTLDGYALSSAMMLVRDTIPSLGSKYHELHRYRAALLAVVLIGGCIGYVVPSIIDIIFYSGSIAVSALLIPLIVSFTRHSTILNGMIVPQLIAPAAAAIVSLATQHGEPIFVGLTTSFLIFGISLIRARYATT